MLFPLLFSLQELMLVLVRWDRSACSVLHTAAGFVLAAAIPFLSSLAAAHLQFGFKARELRPQAVVLKLSVHLLPSASWLWRGWVSVKQERSSAENMQHGWRDGKAQLTALELLSQLRQMRVWWIAVFCHLLSCVWLSRAEAPLSKAWLGQPFPFRPPIFF